jgi:4-hydroxybenzoate polyprenyltransferase
MWKRVCQLLELIRFSHTVFALPFALLAATLAWRETVFRWQDLVGILLCMVFARSAAMAFNRLVDHRIDAENPRTAGRHLPANLLSRSAVWFFTAVCSLGFVASTAMFLPNRWPLILAVPVLLFLLGYSFAKRWTPFSHYWLSAALMLSPLAAWIAIRAEISSTPIWLSAVIFFWVGGFDILYACQDAQYDKETGLRSIPARWGIPMALRIALFSHIATIGCLFGLWYFGELGPIFLASVILVTCLLAYEHSLVKPDDLTRVNIAFFQVNAVISIGLFFAGLVDALMSR